MVGTPPCFRQFIFAIVSMFVMNDRNLTVTRQIAADALSHVAEAAMDQSISSLIDHAGLDRGKVRQLIGRGLEGTDDGELFLEYRQAEALTFDNGQLKQATYDTVLVYELRTAIAH